MRLRLWLGVMILLIVSLSVVAQDFDTNDVSVAEQVTLDSFELTSTALVLHATETASVATRRPTIAPTNTPLTETPATDFDAQSVDEETATPESIPEDSSSQSPLVATFIMFGILLIMLAMFGWVLIRIRDTASEENEEQ